MQFFKKMYTLFKCLCLKTLYSTNVDIQQKSQFKLKIMMNLGNLKWNKVRNQKHPNLHTTRRKKYITKFQQQQ